MSYEENDRPVRRRPERAGREGVAAPPHRPERPKPAPKKKPPKPAPKPKAAKKKKPKARSRFAFGKVFGRSFGKRLLLSVAAALLLMLVLMAFLRVRTVSVVGNRLYSAEEIQQATGINQGSALLLVNKTAVASRIRAQLPYIDAVRVGISLPDTVKVEVVELESTFAVAADDGSYWLINSDGRLVEQITAKAASEYLTIAGVRIHDAQVGAQAQSLEEEAAAPAQDANSADADDDEQTAQNEAPKQASAQERFSAALEILTQLKASEDIRSITSVDVTSIYDMQIWYGTRIQVKLGDTTELSYKLDYMLAAVTQLDSYQSGVLDLTFQEAKKATFIPWPN